MAGPVYFLSDAHIVDAEDTRTKRLIDFLGRCEGEVTTLYLVGDIFEMWLGYETSIYSSFFHVLRAIARLVESGTRVEVFSGNHDPDPGAFFGDYLGVSVHEGPSSFMLGGQKVWVEHGDLVDPRIRRRLPAMIARAKPMRWLARRVHPDTAWRIAKRYGDTLGRRKDYNPLPAGLREVFFPSCVREHGADVVIIGHYHRAVAHQEELDGRSRLFFVLGDWMRHYTYLRWDSAAGFRLMRDDPPGAEVDLGRGEHQPPDCPP